MDMSVYKTSNKSGYRYIFDSIDNYQNNKWCVPLEIQYDQTETHEISNKLTNPKRTLNKMESDRGKEFYISIFEKINEFRNLRHYLWSTDKNPSLAERVI